jgi:hypothetical protein
MHDGAHNARVCAGGVARRESYPGAACGETFVPLTAA